MAQQQKRSSTTITPGMQKRKSNETAKLRNFRKSMKNLPVEVNGETIVWRCGCPVKIYSQSLRRWCPGEISDISQDAEGYCLDVRYWTKNNVPKAKFLDPESPHLKKLYSNKDNNHIKTRYEWDKGDEVECFSNSQQTWFKANIVDIISYDEESDDYLKLQWCIKNDEFMSKELQRSSIWVRHRYPSLTEEITPNDIIMTNNNSNNNNNDSIKDDINNSYLQGIIGNSNHETYNQDVSRIITSKIKTHDPSIPPPGYQGYHENKEEQLDMELEHEFEDSDADDSSTGDDDSGSITDSNENENEIILKKHRPMMSITQIDEGNNIDNNNNNNNGVNKPETKIETNDTNMNELFDDFLDKQSLSDKLKACVKYGLGMINSPTDKPSFNEIKDRLTLFLTSIGKFGDGSFLFPLYGCGDLTPGFTRSSAVNGGIFILEWKPKGIIIKDNIYQGLISPSNQYLKSKYLLTTPNYFKNISMQVNSYYFRMTVISTAPLNLSTSNIDDDSDSSDTDSDEDTKTNANNNGNSNTSGNFVMHIPPNIKEINNPYSINVIQLNHQSYTVPYPLNLTYYLMKCNDNSDVNKCKNALKSCYKHFYDNIFTINGVKPVGLCYTIYEQRQRNINDDNNLANNIFIANDNINDNSCFGYQTIIDQSKSIFNKMYPNLPFMFKDIEPQIPKVEQVFDALE